MTTHSTFTETRALLQHLTSQIPPNLRETEKQRFIHHRLLTSLSPEEHLLLKSYFDFFLREMRQLGASDIELGGWGSGNYIWLRKAGKKFPVKEFGEFTLNEFNILILSILMESQREFLLNRLSFDFSYTIIEPDETLLRYRACIYFELGDLAMNARAIETVIPSYETYGFHSNVTKMLSLRYSKEGLVLITGITGSGKSTTLEAIIDLNNRSIQAHIVVIARPIEYVHKSQKCIIRHREVGMDTHSFKHGTIEALRQDPDIIIIGEMRDPETIMTALEAADSGHKVFSTLHTYSATESIARILGEVPPAEQNRVRHRLAEILRCVISQRLVPNMNNELILAKEVMIVTPPIKAAIHNNNIEEIYQMISEGGEYGMHTLEQDLKRLYLSKQITLKTAINYSNNKRRMEQLLKLVGGNR